ncbi:anthranilate synthase component I [marine actinobacterium PHSC20C1]|nr:anthranilate synthase component I [marine actinobacterium PHSC20C1]
MNRKNPRPFILGGLVLMAALAMLSWTQVWFTFELTDGSTVEALGSDAVSSLAALALSVFALVAALSISTLMVRRVLGILAAVVGVIIVLVWQSALGDPIVASSAIITEATGISGNDSLRALVVSVASTPWSVPAVVSGSFIVLIGLGASLTAHRWPVATKKYDRASTVVADDPASQWDAQSRGIDPTAD